MSTSRDGKLNHKLAPNPSTSTVPGTDPLHVIHIPWDSMLLRGISLALADKVRLGADEGKGMNLMARVWAHRIPSIMKDAINLSPAVVVALKCDDLHGQTFEFLCTVVELAVATLANLLNAFINCNSQAEEEDKLFVDTNILQSIVTVFESVSLCFDSNNQYYKLRKEKMVHREVVVPATRLQSVLEVPGSFVRVSGGDKSDGNVYFYCSQSKLDVLRDGKPCSHESCIPNSEFDSVLVYLAYLFGTSSFGNGYECICWILRHPKRFNSLDTMKLVKNLAERLQIWIWECLLARSDYFTLFKYIGAKLRDTLTRDGMKLEGGAFVQWLDKRDIINVLLKADYDTNSLEEVTNLVVKVNVKGLILQQHLHKLLIQPYVESSDSRELITASVLDSFNISTLSIQILDRILEWLELRKITSPLHGRRILFILSNVVVVDKGRELEKRVLDIFWKHAVHASTSDLVTCLSKVVDHYESTDKTTNTWEDPLLQSTEEIETFLKDCSNADMSLTSPEWLREATDQKQIYADKSKAWEEKEHNLYIDAVPFFKQLISFELPVTRHKTSKTCLERLDTSDALVAKFSTNANGALVCAMGSAMLPELDTLKVLNKEVSVHSQVGQKMRELHDKHLKMYDDLKEKEHKRLKKASEKEKRDFVKETIYLKAKLVTYMKRVEVTSNYRPSSDKILNRMFQKVEKHVTEAEDKHKKMLESLPNEDCSICFMRFTSNRKRACISPCGHASACFNCAGQEYKRTKTCPLCQCIMEKPVQLPNKLFF